MIQSFAHGGSVRGLDCNDRMVVSGSLDGRVRMFDIRSGDVTSTIRLSNATIHAVQLVEALDHRVFFSTGRPENSVYLGDFRSDLENLQQIVKHKNGVSSMVACAYNVQSCDYDGVVSFSSVWDTEKPSLFSKSCGEEVYEEENISKNAFNFFFFFFFFLARFTV